MLRGLKKKKKKRLVHTRIKRSHRGMLDLCLNLLKRYGSAVTCHRGRGSGCSYLGHTACGISPWDEVAINPIIESPSRRPTNCRTIIPKKFSHC